MVNMAPGYANMEPTRRLSLPTTRTISLPGAIFCIRLGLFSKTYGTPSFTSEQHFLQYADDINGRYMRGIPTSWVPSEQAIPVHANAILPKDAWIITSQTTLLPPDTQAVITSTFEDYLSTLPDWDKSLFDGLIMEVSYHEILNRLPPERAAVDMSRAAPNTLLVSNGSAGKEMMAFSWVYLVCSKRSKIWFWTMEDSGRIDVIFPNDHGDSIQGQDGRRS
jgi:hypothetical protein